MSLQNALLGVLDARPMSGYELVQFFDSASGWLWSAPQSQIYPVLRRMERGDLIAGTKSVRGSKLQRTVYTLTPEGRASLLEWVGEYHEPGAPRDPFALQALLFDMIEPESAVRVLKSYAESAARAAQRYGAHADLLRAKDTPLLRERLASRPEADHDRIAALKAHVFEGKAAVARLRVTWAEEAVALITAEESTP